MKSVFKGDLLILMPENAAEAAALARWRDGRDGQCLTLLPPSGPGATLQFIKLPAAVREEKESHTMNAEQTRSEQTQS